MSPGGVVVDVSPGAVAKDSEVEVISAVFPVALLSPVILSRTVKVPLGWRVVEDGKRVRKEVGFSVVSFAVVGGVWEGRSLEEVVPGGCVVEDALGGSVAEGSPGGVISVVGGSVVVDVLGCTVLEDFTDGSIVVEVPGGFVVVVVGCMVIVGICAVAEPTALPVCTLEEVFVICSPPGGWQEKRVPSVSPSSLKWRAVFKKNHPSSSS